MKHMKAFLVALLVCSSIGLSTGQTEQKKHQQDVVKTDKGDLIIHFLGHGTLMFTHAGKVVHVDPWSRLTDYAKMPPADLILLTHEHGDHLDTKALQLLRREKTDIVLTRTCAERVKGGIIMKNGDRKTIQGIKIEAIPAYNIVHKRSNGQAYHPQGRGNGYILCFGNKRVYVAGDTENTPEMKALEKIDVAFLPMNLPYTMTPDMVADAARAFRPKILYPYHYGQTDPKTLVELLKDQTEIKVRIRDMR
jgi:L-ascorbate metabolism protein UlaG (beta-lactamase superfamily)